MKTLNKRVIGDTDDRYGASPFLIVVALVLFFILIVATVDLHRKDALEAFFLIGLHGISPVFVGP